MAEQQQATKKAAATKTAARKPMKRASYDSLDEVPDADQGNGTLVRDVHMYGEVYPAGTKAKDLPDGVMEVLAKNEKAWAHDEPEDDEDE